MKKTLLTTLLALSVTAVSALELGAMLGTNYGPNEGYAGVTISDSINTKVVGTLGYERGTQGDNTNTWTGVVSYKVGESNQVNYLLNGGVGYMDTTPADGWLGLVGVGISFPIYKNTTIGADYNYQFTESAMDAYSGAKLSANVKYKF